MDIGMDMDYSKDMGTQHGDLHVACIRHVCVHIRFVPFDIFASDHTVFVLLLFASYHIPFASICFLSYSIQIPNFLICFEVNISESNPLIH
jgi:hypothetical protein